MKIVEGLQERYFRVLRIKNNSNGSSIYHFSETISHLLRVFFILENPDTVFQFLVFASEN